MTFHAPIKSVKQFIIKDVEVLWVSRRDKKRKCVQTENVVNEH